MGTIRSLIALPAVAALLGLGTGCAGGGFWKHKPADYPTETTGATASRPEASAVVPAGGTSPLASVPSSLAWLTGKTDKAAKGGPVTLAPAWRNHIDDLPDPARAGAMGPGLAGQLFAFGPADLPATLDGSITVDLFDVTRCPAGQPGIQLERWKFNKDVLKALRAVDERFGPNYVLFLPWPTYRPDVTRVRIAIRYDPANGSFPIYAPESKLSLDPTLAGVGETGATLVRPPAQQSGGVAPTGGMTGGAAAGSTTGATDGTPGPGMGVIQMGRPARAPASAGAAGASGLPGGLPPLAIINPVKPN